MGGVRKGDQWKDVKEWEEDRYKDLEKEENEEDKAIKDDKEERKKKEMKMCRKRCHKNNNGGKGEDGKEEETEQIEWKVCWEGGRWQMSGKEDTVFRIRIKICLLDPGPGGKIALNIYRFNGGYRTGNIEVRILL